MVRRPFGQNGSRKERGRPDREHRRKDGDGGRNQCDDFSRDRQRLAIS